MKVSGFATLALALATPILGAPSINDSPDSSTDIVVPARSDVDTRNIPCDGIWRFKCFYDWRSKCIGTPGYYGCKEDGTYKYNKVVEDCLKHCYCACDGTADKPPAE